MNSEFNLYDEQFQMAAKQLLAKFHTAPSNTPQDYQQALEEFAQLKQAYESMKLLDAQRAKNYKSDYDGLKAKFDQYVNHCSPTLAMAKQQNADLRDYIRTAYEAEGNAVKIQFELSNQTRKLEKIIGTNKATQQELRDSETLISRMRTRGCLFKILAYSMIVLLCLGIAAILWVKLS